MKQKTYKRIKITLAVFLALFIVIEVFVSVLMVLSYTVDFSRRILPSYAREDITAVLGKTEWTDEDYEYLYHQTGLGKAALDELKISPDDILNFQDAFWSEPEFEHDMAAVTTPRDKIVGEMLPIVPLKEGDVLISSSTHTFGWRNGHAAIVVNGEDGRTLESMALGKPSVYGTVKWFQESSNFMVLRLKEEYRSEIDPAEVAADAVKKLKGIDYSIFVGFLSPKDQCENGRQITVTHCSHIVWQAYKNFGLDIDPNGGALVTAQDISHSPYFEVVQVNGFDPDKLWN